MRFFQKHPSKQPPFLRIVKGSNNEKLFEGGKKVKHNLKISVSKEPKQDGIVACKQMNPKDRKFKSMLNGMSGVMIIVPGNSVQDITISEVDSKGGEHATC